MAINTLCSLKGDYGGLDMLSEWMKKESPSNCCMDNYQAESETEFAHFFDTKTLAKEI